MNTGISLLVVSLAFLTISLGRDSAYLTARIQGMSSLTSCCPLVHVMHNSTSDFQAWKRPLTFDPIGAHRPRPRQAQAKSRNGLPRAPTQSSSSSYSVQQPQRNGYRSQVPPRAPSTAPARNSGGRTLTLRRTYGILTASGSPQSTSLIALPHWPKRAVVFFFL